MEQTARQETADETTTDHTVLQRYRYNDDWGSEEFRAASDADAHDKAWGILFDGEYEPEGGIVRATVTQIDDDGDEIGEPIEVELEVQPDHERLIAEAVDRCPSLGARSSVERCGATDPESHDWERVPDSAWGHGAAVSYDDRCSGCGLIRTTTSDRTVSGPDQVSYELPTEPESDE